MAGPVRGLCRWRSDVRSDSCRHGPVTEPVRSVGILDVTGIDPHFEAISLPVLAGVDFVPGLATLDLQGEIQAIVIPGHAELGECSWTAVDAGKLGYAELGSPILEVAVDTRGFLPIVAVEGESEECPMGEGGQVHRISFRILPVWERLLRATFSGVPLATTRPPASPPSGPMSMT